MQTTFFHLWRAGRRSAATVGALGALTVACTSDLPDATDPGSPDLGRQNVASVTVDPASVTGIVGQTGQFSAIVKDAAGNSLNRVITWTSQDSTILTINQTGFATGLRAGTTRVIASAGGKSGYSTVTVNPIPVASVVVTPGTAGGAVGDSAQFGATLKDANGNTLTDRTVTWSSSNTAVATVSATGMGRAVGAGSATLTATSEGQVGQASVTVVGPPPPTVAVVSVTPGSASGAVGDSGQFSATVLDATGAVMTGQTVTWSSSNTSVATVSASGMARAVGGGTAAIIATSGGKSGQATVTVSGGTQPPPPPPPPATPASVSVSPASVGVWVAATQLLAATVRDASGNVMTGQAVSWTTSNAQVATVVDGLVTGLVPGSVTITATAGTASGTAALTVSSPLPPPPPPGAWPNAPSAYPLISDQPMDALNSLGWNLVFNNATTMAVDGAAPQSASNVMQFKYPAGMPGGTAPGTYYYGLQNATHFYSGIWWKPSSPWQGHNSNINKIQFLYLNGGSGDMALEMYGPPGGPYEIRVCMQLVGADPRCWLTPNKANVAVTLGQWHRIEWQVEYGTPGQANGLMRWWLDGQLIGDYHDIIFPSNGLVEYKISPTWGGMGDVKQTTDYYWFDHVYVRGY